MANVTFSTVQSLSTFKGFLGEGKTKAGFPLKDGGLYFIEDVGIIMRATVTDSSGDNTKVDATAKEYSGKVQSVSGDWPNANAASVVVGALYIKGNVGKVSNGTSWTTVFEPGQATASVASDSTGIGAVSGNTVYNYIDTNSTASPDASTPSNDSGKLLKLNSSGKIDSGFLPAVAISEFKGKITTSKSDLDALEAENGDWAVLELANDTNNENGTYIYFDDDDSTNTDTPRWIPMADVSSAALTAQLNAKVNTSDVQSSVVSNGTNPVNGTAVASYVGTEIATALTWGTVSAS